MLIEDMEENVKFVEEMEAMHYSYDGRYDEDDEEQKQEDGNDEYFYDLFFTRLASKQ
jgi:hypothetical protein